MILSRGHSASALVPQPSRGRAFPGFPYTPYQIQQDFMTQLYTTVESRGIGLLESPTGTGKTLSLICSTLQWLQDHIEANKVPDQPRAKAQEASLPAWLMETILPAPKVEIRPRLASKPTQRKPDGQQAKASQRPTGTNHSRTDEADAEFLLPEYRDVQSGTSNKRLSDRMEDEGDSSGDERTTGSGHKPDRPPRQHPQVVFCSRTHSQLSQFVGELRRTPFAQAFNTVALASRKVLCINDSVLKLGHSARINERCLEMQQNKASQKKKTGWCTSPAADKAKSKCPHLKSPEELLAGLQEGLQGEGLDVEELARLGKAKGLCPYYAARAAQQHADLVLLPYSALLSQDMRESLGLQLDGAVVVIDEAHNLVDAVHSVHSAALTHQQLQSASAQLSAYMQRFESRLAPGNSQHLQALTTFTERLLQRSEPISGHESVQKTHNNANEPSTTCLQRINEFLFAAGLDNLNLFELIRYVKHSKVLFKVAGFADSARARGEPLAQPLAPADNCTAGSTLPPAAEASHSGALQAVLAFAQALTHADCNGRIVIDSAPGTMKFISLNAAEHFAPIVKAARAVILASGTLAPIHSLCTQLFPDAAEVSMNRLLCLPVGQGPTGLALELGHRRRSSDAMLDEIGRLLLNICQAIPQGVVAFFPSFAFMGEAIAHWKATGVWAQLSARKTLFQEPRLASEVETMLKDYSSAALGQAPEKAVSSNASMQPDAAVRSRNSGALLLCVVGGKLAEGINFGNGLGRCVVMLGLPYPNPTDPELCERMRYLDNHQPHTAAATPGRSGSTSAGQQYYEDLCMKAVNQCIGRVIRHAGDWAAIVLADVRWTTPSRKHLQQLPVWIQTSLPTVPPGFGPAYARLHAFARAMKAADASAVKQQ
ncbi:hypothetical protein WJX73_001436 [Symbiochloris irregularis]|uniref:Helicase ATP-binding domain-containing protein n=1 Tax=Symbiochloris irregularis TaxID=706552 RepID=A0AAW1NSH9_9CHLO